MVKTDANIRSSYKRYIKSRVGDVPLNTFLSIANGYMEFLVDKILDGEEVALPARLGSMKIVGTKRTLVFDSEGKPKLPPDWVKTKELWANNPEAKAERKLVYHLNEETDGIVYRYHWSRVRVFMENKDIYALRMTRQNKRAVNKKVVKDKKEYIVRTYKRTK